MVVIDVLNDPGGRELLFNKYGLRKVPVLAKGDQYAFGQMLEPFAKFAGFPSRVLTGCRRSSSTRSTKWSSPRGSVTRGNSPPSASASA